MNIPNRPRLSLLLLPFLLFLFLNLNLNLNLSLSCASARAETIRAAYGLPSATASDPATYEPLLAQGAVTAVFLPDDPKTIQWFKSRGYKVYISMNVFGGTGAWKEYPDSRPIKADGKLLDEKADRTGGICPTHGPWREGRLKHLEGLIKGKGHSGKDAIDGIWLDFIRYPGYWEDKNPAIPDTCYCPRCLEKFRKEKKVDLPSGLGAAESAAWIRKHAPVAWMEWKNEQILSFVRDARQVINRYETQSLLGIFIVPWRKGERLNDVTYLLAQDPFRLAAYADVISPMVYHDYCGKDTAWVARMVNYYKETAGVKVWPIIEAPEAPKGKAAAKAGAGGATQAGKPTPAGEAGAMSREARFGEAVKAARDGGADGILVFSFNRMDPSLWPRLAAFEPKANLIANPAFLARPGSDDPDGWSTRKPDGGAYLKSSYLYTSMEFMRTGRNRAEKVNYIGITGGDDRAGEWRSALPPCEAGKPYTFSAYLVREALDNGVFPSFGIWGREFSMDYHFLARLPQHIRFSFTCPEGAKDSTFRFMNHNAGKTFWLTEPRLVTGTPPEDEKIPPPAWLFAKDHFPIGIYGAEITDIPRLAQMGIDTVVAGGKADAQKRMVDECRKHGLKYLLSAPMDPDMLPVYLREMGPSVRPGEVAFYVNDEPELRSFPVSRARDIHLLVKEAFPESTTAMAVERAEKVRDYQGAADIFMMDQYPVPSMPMRWLSDSLDIAKDAAGPQRLASVIQAFGGKKWARDGWSRFPTKEEMDCLAFLSVIHGSRGIFFYAFGEAAAEEEGLASIAHVAARLKKVYPWILEPDMNEKVTVTITSPYGMDPKGTPAIHAIMRKKESRTLLLAVNTAPTYVTARLSPFAPASGTAKAAAATNLFKGEHYVVTGEGLTAEFAPYETKALVFE